MGSGMPNRTQVEIDKDAAMMNRIAEPFQQFANMDLDELRLLTDAGYLPCVRWTYPGKPDGMSAHVCTMSEALVNLGR